MKVLVTGGAGFIGSHVVDRLVEAGHEVSVVDNLLAGRRQQVNPAARLHQVDVRDPSLAEVFRQQAPELVVHLAGLPKLRASVEDPVTDAEINAIGSLQILECCRRQGVGKVVYASSYGVYGTPRYLPCDEAHPVQPASPYGVSKHVVEQYLYVYGLLHALNYVALRFASVYGPRQDPEGEAGAVAIFVQKMLANEPTTINGAGDQGRDFIYVDDVITAVECALARGNRETLNVGTGVPRTVLELWQVVARLTNYSREPVFGPRKAGDVDSIYVDPDQALSSLGWRATTTFEEGLRRTIEAARR